MTRPSPEACLRQRPCRHVIKSTRARRTKVTDVYPFIRTADVLPESRVFLRFISKCFVRILKGHFYPFPLSSEVLKTVHVRPHRKKCGCLRLCFSFSKNAFEERILTIRSRGSGFIKFFKCSLR